MNTKLTPADRVKASLHQDLEGLIERIGRLLKATTKYVDVDLAQGTSIVATLRDVQGAVLTAIHHSET